ncbi:MAG: TIGR01459 family HAD-type hydrolase [Alphaproteobacteria bacterium]|nr:TIGR01459 family HAD-type hydrolase [Alphaproteobacteria bacterium]
MIHNNTSTKHITHLSTGVDRYSVFVLPVFGTLHNGKRLSEKAFTCLRNLAGLGKNVAIFSNVPKRRHVLIQDLANIGIPPSLYQHVITSGEEVFHALKDRKDAFHSSLGKKCYVIGSSQSLSLLEGLNLSRVTFIDEADFILALGPDEWHSDLEYYKPALKQAADLELPLLCASPDLYVKYQGQQSIRAGALALYYESLGGQVGYHGKPYKPFYESLLRDLEPFQKSDVLIFGDSFLTDIKGAMAMKIDSLLGMSDTTAVELQMTSQEMKSTSMDLIQEKIQAFGAVPTYIMEELSW